MRWRSTRPSGSETGIGRFPRGVAIVSRLYRVYSDQVGEGFAHYAIAGSSGLQYRCHDREVDEGDADRQEQRHD